LCYFICAFNLAIRRSFQSHIGPGHNYYCFIAVFTESVLFYIESQM
jgi:hypothetical protein